VLLLQRTGHALRLLQVTLEVVAAVLEVKELQHVGYTVHRMTVVFEFLGLRSREVMGESEIEGALLDKLQDFLLELGRGFCFEARQKRILIGDEQFFVDLVF
jgi:predicted nuclease of restriction endonuclease-like (RecB) superfamily